METDQVVEQQTQVALPGEAETPVVEPVEVEAAQPHDEDDPEYLDIVKEMGLDPDQKGRLSKRVKQLLGRAKTAEEKAREEADEKARWREEVYRRDAMRTTTVAPDIQIDTSDLPVPTREAFDHDEDAYQAAIAERAAVIAYRRERTRERQQESVQQQQQQADANIVWQQEGRKRFSDFDVALRAPQSGGPVITDQMAAAIIGNESGHDVAYFLGKNPQESNRIASLHPVEQSIEIKKIANRLAKSQPKTTTTAPTTTSPVGDREVIYKPTKPLHEMDFKEYEAFRNRQIYGDNWGRK